MNSTSRLVLGVESPVSRSPFGSLRSSPVEWETGCRLFECRARDEPPA